MPARRIRAPDAAATWERSRRVRQLSGTNGRCSSSSAAADPRVPMPQEIDRTHVQRLMRERAQVVEVLPKEEFEQDHLPGAISLPLRSLETEARGTLDPARPILVYCWD